jgi:hypothetical protein
MVSIIHSRIFIDLYSAISSGVLKSSSMYSASIFLSLSISMSCEAILFAAVRREQLATSSKPV